MSSSYTYTTKIGSLKEFLQKVKTKELGVPAKVTLAYLSSIGFKSKNDRPILAILKSIGFVDGSGIPTSLFNEFRTDKSEQVMASAIKKAYNELFGIYPEPYNKPNEDLTNFFAQKQPSLKKGTLQYLVNTFRALCDFADFEKVTTSKSTTVKEAEKKVVEVAKITTEMPSGVTINVNVQLTLPATEDATVYDKIFKALKDNLLSRD